ncbi:MAG: zinc-binding dehydrogenase [Desulfobacter sp.]
MTDLPKIMSGVWLTGHGGPEKLVYATDIPVPVPGPGDVLVKVAAAAVNNTDINTRLAWYSKKDGDGADASWAGQAIVFPRIQGIDVCGHIAAVGTGVDPARIGERVLIEPCLAEMDGQIFEQPGFLGSECDGGFAQYTRVASRHAHEISSRFSDVELASFPCSYSTAENMLTRAGVTKGERVVVTGASGGVGSAAVQLATARGAEVVAVTSPSKSDRVLSLGASQTLSRGDDPVAILGENAVDVVVDLVAGPVLPRFLDTLKSGGRYAIAGAMAGPMAELDMRTVYLKDLSFFGCTRLGTGVFANLVRLIEAEKISPAVAETFALSDIRAAQDMFMKKGFVGKIVLNIPE